MVASTKIVAINLANPKCKEKVYSQPEKEKITRGGMEEKILQT